MIIKKIIPDNYTFSFLIRKANSFNVAWGLFEKMKKWKIRPNNYIFNFLIRTTNNFKDLKKSLDAMLSYGVHSDFHIKRTINYKLKKFGRIEKLSFEDWAAENNFDFEIKRRYKKRYTKRYKN